MATTTWSIDPSHSEVQFKVKHLVISTVTGSFGTFEGQLKTEGEDFTNAQVSFSADVNSISTGNEQRDAHLKAPDFFDAATYPKLTFESVSFTNTGTDTYEVVGNLTLRGVTKSITLQVEFGGIQQDFYGNTKAGFEISGKINRKDFGLTWSATTEAGGIVVSDEVRLLMNIQVAKQQEVAQTA
jgi:polyisoprenoid-binding protein YceI